MAACLLVALAASPALPHGVEMTSGLGQAAWIRAAYADGQPMEFAKVRVLAPEGSTHQVGNADAQGRFAWLADQTGQWKVVAEDGMGHRGEAVLDSDKPGAASFQAAPTQGGGQSAWSGIQLGLSAIFWLSGLLFWCRSRRGPAGSAAKPSPPAS